MHRSLGVLIALVLTAGPAMAQQLGHKIMGSLGLYAGTQPDAGLYALNQFASYGSDDIYDRYGQRIPVNLDLDAVGNFVGFQWTLRLPHSLYLNIAASGPISHVSLTSDQPEASLDQFGLGDVYFQPVKIGWKSEHMDIVGGYAFYAPTGLYLPHANGSVGAGQWTHQFTFGGTVYFDRAKAWRFSCLASYDLNQRKEGIDITRGDTFAIQGGAGKRFRIGKSFGALDVGPVGYGLWQVRDDRGADLPAALRGARDIALGLGPEVDYSLPRIRSRFTVRYCRDVVAKSRPLGRILVFGVVVLARK
jgi:hypothetical protein